MRQISSTNTFRPALRKVLIRERVFQTIRERLDYPLIWIDRDAGSGKTTLVSSLLEKDDLHHLWYRVSDSDNSVVDFLCRFANILSDYLPKSTKSIQMLSLPFQPEISSLYKMMFSEIQKNVSSPFYLILDDFHLIDNDAFHEMLVTTLIEFENVESKIIVISRHKPLAAYSRLRARQKFTRLNRNFFDWNEEEVISLTNLLSNYMFDESLGRRYFQITRGWVAGVILLNQSAIEKGRSDRQTEAFDREFLFDYFACEIFSNMDLETQLFLMKASFLNEIDIRRDENIFSSKKLKTI